VGKDPVAPGKKNAWRLKASIVFLDESGLLMAPFLRRTWAPVGETPILYQRGRSHQRISMIAALTVSPRRRRVGLYFSLLPNENVVTQNLLPFVRGLRRELGSPLVLVWDRLNVHRSASTELRRRSRSIHPVFLPPYAPELNPVESFWSYLKMNPLANHAADQIDELHRRAKRHSRQIARDQALLRSFLQATPLFLRLR
jgi:transposase